MNRLLIIFVKNPLIGRVKTRLAASIGKQAALEVYQELLEYTRTLTEPLPFDKAVFYSDHIDEKDDWGAETFQKYCQTGEDLGERMRNAFDFGFAKGYHSICIIGSDCYELTSDILAKAFRRLQEVPVVIGPSLDGGYYLLGMNRLESGLFENKKWSTNTVFADTMSDLNEWEIAPAILPQLRDVDREADLITLPFWSKKEDLL